jgi:hypothetical protein
VADTLLLLKQSFTLITCTNCGVAFAVPDDFVLGRRNSGIAFSCPNGHILSYRETTADALRKELAEKQILIDQAHNREFAAIEALKRAESARKRLEKRVANGVCPVPGCKRHFTDLNLHMKTEHKGIISLPEGQLTKQIAGPVQ